MEAYFEWDNRKNEINKRKHKVSFEEAQFYCFGIVNGDVMTVRFTYRNNKIRIIGAGYWRKGKQVYEETYSV